MTVLSEISVELAEKLLEEVSFENRFEGYRKNSMSGSHGIFIFTFENLVKFMNEGHTENLTQIGARSQFTYIDLDALKNGIVNNYGDKELSDEIGKEIEKGNSYIERLPKIVELLNYRQHQCEEIIEKNEL